MMVAKLLPALIGLAGAGASAAISASAARKASQQTAKMALPLPVATRDDAAARVQREDELRKRRGTAANVMVGAADGEVTGSAPKVLTGE